MESQRRSTLIAGSILVLLGVWFLVVQFVPTLTRAFYGPYGWPLWIVGIGGLLLLIGVLTWTPAMAVPAAIVGGIGALLYWQNLTGHWESWAYAWALIPGFAGVGTIVFGLWSGRLRTMWAGLWQVVISGVLCLIFASFLGGLNIFGPYWPALLIALGILIIAQRLLWPRHE